MNVYLELNNPFADLVFHPLTIEFILGCLIAINLYRKDNQIPKTRPFLAIAFVGLVISICVYSLYQYSTGNIDPEGWWRILIFGTPATIIVYCFIYAERNGFVVHSSLIKIGDASYSIYLSHILTLSAFGRIWNAFASDSLYDNYIMVPVLFILVIIIGMVSFRYIEKPLLTYSRKIA